MSGVNKALNIISYYVMTLCAKPLLRYPSVIILHYGPIITSGTFIKFTLLHY